MTSIAPTEAPAASAPHPHRSLAYRPAIDGLRAFAVVSVILFHGVERYLPGGWFGVDVFFVISGFLITSLLLTEHRRWGSIHLMGFWLARLRRLLPALFLPLLAVLVAAVFLTPSGRRASVGHDALATLGYVANWRYLFGDEAYFAQIAAPSPLRHTWSLSVEEQYYVVFPLLLTGILAWSRRRIRVAIVLAVIAALSALLMSVLFTPGGDPNRVYYGTDTRAHELLVGAAIAALVARGPGALSQRAFDRLERAARIAAIPALALVVSAFWWATRLQDALFEGLLVPLCIAVGIVLVAAASHTSSPVQRLLSWEPLRRIGLISYGLYLWHWPIIVFLTPRRTGLPELPNFAVQLILTAALSSLSYRFVEKPVRQRGPGALVPERPRLGRAVAWLSVPTLVAGALALPALGTMLSPVAATTGSDVRVDPPPYAPGGRYIRATIMGNSVPQVLGEKFDGTSYPDLQLSSNTNVGCEPVVEPRYIEGDIRDPLPACKPWLAGWEKAIEDTKPDVVVLFVSQSLVADRMVDGQRVAFGSPAFEAYLDKQLDTIRRRTTGGTDRELLLVNTPCHRMDDFGNPELIRVNDDRYVKKLNAMVGTWARRNDVPVADQFGLLCTGGYHSRINGVELYGDGIHFTDQSAPIIWSWLAPQIQQAADRRNAS